MASSVVQTTQPPPLFGSFVPLVFMWVLAFPGVGGQCQLPVSLRGDWEDSEKGVLTFSNQSVAGYPIHAFGQFTLSCRPHNDSALYFIMETAPFSYFGLNFTAYLCWSFDEQSSKLIHLYEHTDPNSQLGNEKVKMYMPITSWDFQDVCSNTNTSALSYRQLHKYRPKTADKSRKRRKRDQTGIIVAIVVLVVVIGLVAVVTFFLIRRRKSRGMFQVNVKSADARCKASAYRVHEPEHHVTPPPPFSSFKTTTTTTRNPNPTQTGKHNGEDSTSEAAPPSPSSVSVTATSAFTCVSASSSFSASSSVFSSASVSGLPNQEVSSPMTPVSGSEGAEARQLGSEQFVPVQFSSAAHGVAGFDEGGGASAFMADGS